MKDEYIIINKTALLKRIEELEALWDVHSTNPNKTMLCIEYQEKIDLLKEILSQSTPLIPEIENAFDKGYRIAKGGFQYIPSKRDYISNLKLK